MKTTRCAYVFAAALSLACASLPAAVAAPVPVAQAGSSGDVSPELTALREQGIALHDQAVEGDEELAGNAVAQLERYLRRLPDDGEARGLPRQRLRDDGA